MARSHHEGDVDEFVADEIQSPEDTDEESL
jgi:hypothetical protein